MCVIQFFLIHIGIYYKWLSMCIYLYTQRVRSFRFMPPCEKHERLGTSQCDVFSVCVCIHVSACFRLIFGIQQLHRQTYTHNERCKDNDVRRAQMCVCEEESVSARACLYASVFVIFRMSAAHCCEPATNHIAVGEFNATFCLSPPLLLLLLLLLPLLLLPLFSSSRQFSQCTQHIVHIHAH